MAEMCCGTSQALFFSFSSLLLLSLPFVGLTAFGIIISVKKNKEKKKTYFRIEMNHNMSRALLPPFIVLASFK